MNKPILNVLSAIAAAIVVIGAVTAPYFICYHQSREVKELRTEIDSLQTIMCGMQTIDSLSISASEKMVSAIESLMGDQAISKGRLTAIENWAKEVDADLDSFD